jgi:UDP-glucose 4-epimerase
MRVAVTGGSGFIGAHVVDRLVAAGHEVEVIDLRAPERDDVRHWPVDLADLDGLVRATEGLDAVFHLAAVADVNDAAADPVQATDVNVAGTARVWEACRVNKVPRAVLASTVWVYSGADDDGNAEGMLDEDAAFRLDEAGHLYTSSKLAAELVVHSYNTLYGQPFTILRYGIPYGPGMRDSLVISKFVRMALDDDPITIQGDGSQYRNYVYVEDLAEAHVLALREEAAGEVFNLEGTESITIRQLVECIEELVDKPLSVEYIEARAGDYAGKAISAEKAARVLGWKPQVPFEEGLRRYLAWYQARVARANEAEREVHAAAMAAPGTHDAPAAPADETLEPVSAGTATRLRSLAGLAVAIPTVLSLSVDPGTSGSGRLYALIGSLVGIAMAALVSHRRRHAIPAVLSAGVLVATIWLVSQSSPGLISIALGALMGVAVGAIAPAPLRFERDTVFFAGAGFAVLVMAAAVSEHLLWWSATVLALVATVALDRISIPVPNALPARRPSWVIATAVVALTMFTASWAGATSSTAAWLAGPVVYHGPRSDPEVAITFDGARIAGPTQQLLAALSNAHVEATFFENGQAIDAQPQLARAIEAHGHLLANESWKNNGFDWLDPGYRDLRRAQAVFAQRLGICPTYFRPPHAPVLRTPFMERAAHAQGMTMVTWDVKTGVRANDNAATFAHRVLAKIRPGSIVALELPGNDADANQTVVQAIPLILQGMHERGLTPVRLDKLLDSRGYTGCSADRAASHS